MKVRIGIYLGEGDHEHKLGPGKVALLEAVAEYGSISGAARALGLSYRHAWARIDDLNRCFREPVVTTATGGPRGGGATLTEFGHELVERFHAIEQTALGAIDHELRALTAQVRRRGRR